LTEKKDSGDQSFRSLRFFMLKFRRFLTLKLTLKFLINISFEEEEQSSEIKLTKFRNNKEQERKEYKQSRKNKGRGQKKRYCLPWIEIFF
jgi:hypothetical protein